MEVRANERDQSFLRRYLSQELCEELHLFAYAAKGDELVVTEVSDDQGWKAILPAYGEGRLSY
ncbi:MAG: SpoVR family protein [Anaerospora sp.]|nr:SpoVR family protein [Anaerospora sp.]